MLSNKQIKKFQLLWKNRFGKEISQEEAYKKGIKLIRLVELTFQPMTKDEYKKYKPEINGKS
ncbi:hypothetical protein ACFL06_00765 [Patescibacteria group bacterium]